MRKQTARDLLATLLVAAVVVPFIGYSARGSMPYVHDTKGMAGWTIIGGLLAFAAFGRKPAGTGLLEWTIITLSLLTLGFAIAALVAETMWALLVPAVASLVALWALALMHEAGLVAPEHATRHA